MATLFTGVVAVGQRTSPPLRHPPGRRATLTIEVTALTGPVRFEFETSDDGMTWRREHRCDMEGPGRSVCPVRRGRLLRVRKSGARCAVTATTDRGDVEG